MDLISFIIDIIESAAIIMAAGVAIYGVNAWRREIKWKKKYELAEEVLSLIYEAEDAFRIIRNPFTFAGEGTDSTEENDKLDAKSLPIDRMKVVFSRYERYKDTFNKIRTIKYRFLAIYGKEHEKLFYDFEKLLPEIFTAARMLSDIYWPTRDYSRMDEEYYKQ